MLAAKTEFTLRKRMMWESLDLAALMFRRWALPIALSFGIPFALACAAFFSLFGPLLTLIPPLVVWWLKPIWDRLILIPAGILLFDPHASRKDLLRGMVRVFSFSLLHDLSWRRLSPYRAYLLPLYLFERGPSQGRAKRKKWLCSDMGGIMLGLNALFIALEIIVAVSLFQTYSIAGSSNLVASTVNSVETTAQIIGILYCLSVLVVEPLFALSCFSLYINRRSGSEAWDLQLAFTRLRTRFVKAVKPLPIAIFAIILILSPFMAEAQEVDSIETGESSFARKAGEVLSNPDFGKSETRKILAIKETPKSKEKQLEEMDFSALDGIIARLLRICAIAVAFVLVFMLFFFNRHRLPWIARLFRKNRNLPVEPLSIAKLPATCKNPLEASIEAWNDGRMREALSYLYRGLLSLASNRYGLILPESATERDCLCAISSRANDPEFVTLARELIRVWIMAAWAGIFPAEDDFMRLYSRLIGGNP